MSDQDPSSLHGKIQFLRGPSEVAAGAAFLNRPESPWKRSARRRRGLFDAEVGGPPRSDVRARFPYMFKGPHATIVLYRGWTPILGRACEHIDRIVAARGLEFHWICLDEEDGVARFIYAMNDRSRYLVDIEGRSRRALTHVNSEVLTGTTRRVDSIVLNAERMTSEACIVCGLRCHPSRYFGRLLPLCREHRPENINESSDDGLEKVWRLSIEWASP